MNILVYDKKIRISREEVDSYNYVLRFDPRMDLSQISAGDFVDFYVTDTDEYKLAFIVKCMSLGAKVSIKSDVLDICGFWSRYCTDVICTNEAGKSDAAVDRERADGLLTMAPVKEGSKKPKKEKAKEEKPKKVKEEKPKKVKEEKPKKTKEEKPKKAPKVKGNEFRSDKFGSNPSKKDITLNKKPTIADSLGKALKSLDKKGAAEEQDEMVTLSFAPSEKTKTALGNIKKNLTTKKQEEVTAAEFLNFDESKLDIFTGSNISMVDESTLELNTGMDRITDATNKVAEKFKQNIYKTPIEYLIGEGFLTKDEAMEAEEEARAFKVKKRVSLTAEDMLVKNQIIDEVLVLKAIKEIYNVEVISSEMLGEIDIKTKVYPKDVCTKYLFVQISEEPNILVSTIHNSLQANLGANFNNAQIRFALGISIITKIMLTDKTVGWQHE